MERYSPVTLSLVDVKDDLYKLHTKIQDLLYKVGHDFDNVQYDEKDLDEDFFYRELYQVADKLYGVEKVLTYLSKPVSEQGIIRQNRDGRYELPSGTFLTSGSMCEILTPEPFDKEKHYWILTQIQHTGYGYYSTKLGRDTSINGMMVRVRT